jgi:superfamily I DNA/RNA helicase
LAHTSALVERFEELSQRLDELRGLGGTDLVNALFPADEPWAAPLRAVVEKFGASGDPEELLATIQRGVTQPELPTDVDYVRVMSLHKAKGLTADMVVVAGCIEGLIPTVLGDLPLEEQIRSLEEQRRLLYVAITRARHTLVLSSVTVLPRNLAYRMRAAVLPGGGQYAPVIASRFLSELGPSRPATIPGVTIVAGGSIRVERG